MPLLLRSMQKIAAEATQTTAEPALRQDPSNNFAALAESLPVGIFRTDSDGNCFFVNRCWCNLSGLTSEQAEGQGWLTSIDPDDLKEVQAEWRSCLMEGREFRSQFRLANSRMTWVLGQALAERDPHGNFIGYFGTVTDITD